MSGYNDVIHLGYQQFGSIRFTWFLSGNKDSQYYPSHTESKFVAVCVCQSLIVSNSVTCGLQPTSLCPQNFSGKNTGVDSYSLLEDLQAGIKPSSPVLQAESLLSEPSGKLAWVQEYKLLWIALSTPSTPTVWSGNSLRKHLLKASIKEGRRSFEWTVNSGVDTRDDHQIP